MRGFKEMSVEGQNKQDTVMKKANNETESSTDRASERKPHYYLQ